MSDGLPCEDLHREIREYNDRREAEEQAEREALDAIERERYEYVWLARRRHPKLIPWRNP